MTDYHKGYQDGYRDAKEERPQGEWVGNYEVKKMRLIDADKLRPDCLTKDGKIAISQSQIANAPTVNIIQHEDWFLVNKAGAKELLDRERPQG